MAKLFFLKTNIIRLMGVIAVLLSFAASLNAQINYKFTSIPDSATVLLDGKVLGKTPFEAHVDKSKFSDTVVFVFRKDKYDDSKFVVSEKPKYKDNYKEVILKKIRPYFNLDSNSVLVNFDKVMTEFPMGKIVGHNKTFYGGDIYWDAYSRVGVKQFFTKADDILGSAGFRTPFIKGNELFSSQETEVQTERFLIGGKLLDIWVGLGPTTLIGIRANNWATFEWKVFDKVLNKVVLVDSSRGEMVGVYKTVTELNVMMDLFQNGMESFLLNGKFYEIVKNAGAEAPIGTGGNVVANNSAALPHVAIPTFESIPAMIQYANKSCLTVKSGNNFASGVVISESGLVLSTASIASKGGAVSIALSNGVELEAKVLKSDAATDIALLQVQGSKFQALPLGKGFSAGLGDEIVTIGTPKSVEMGQSVGKGIVSGKVQVKGLTYIQTDMAATAGNAGGPLINKQGQIIGIVSKGADGKAIALPIETACKNLGLKVAE